MGVGENEKNNDCGGGGGGGGGAGRVTVQPLWYDTYFVF